MNVEPSLCPLPPALPPMGSQGIFPLNTPAPRPAASVTAAAMEPNFSQRTRLLAGFVSLASIINSSLTSVMAS